MFTDDTYRFVRGAKKVREYLRNLDVYCKAKSIDFAESGSENVTADALQARKEAVVAALSTMVDCYKYAWAKPDIDSIFKVHLLLKCNAHIMHSPKCDIFAFLPSGFYVLLQDAIERMQYFQGPTHETMVACTRALQARRNSLGKNEKGTNLHQSWNV